MQWLLWGFCLFNLIILESYWWKKYALGHYLRFWHQENILIPYFLEKLGVFVSISCLSVTISINKALSPFYDDRNAIWKKLSHKEKKSASIVTDWLRKWGKRLVIKLASPSSLNDLLNVVRMAELEYIKWCYNKIEQILIAIKHIHSRA